MNTLYPDFQDALLACVDAGVSGVTVSLGWPAGGLEDEHVWIPGNGTVEARNEMSTLSQREETISTEIRIKVDYLASEFVTARNRAFEISSDVEDAISADPTLSGLVNWCKITNITVDEAIPDDRIRQVGITLTVSAHASIS